ncbi:MAG: isoaspartyl peptidase/L-asparaginase [Acidobacteriota bacterium]
MSRRPAVFPFPLRLVLAVLVLAVGWLACAAPPEAPPDAAGDAAAESAATPAEPVAWALAIHGGAGVIPKDLPDEDKQGYYADLEAALALGKERLERGDAALDVVEVVIQALEDSPRFNAGKGAVFTHDGRNELDAAIMDGTTGACGAVARVTTVKNPITLARGVMERSKHVFMVGDGAEVFADEMGLERVEPEYFYTERRWQALQKAIEREEAEGAGKHGTVGCVVLDREGRLAAGTSTGGLTNKRFGRIGDVPVFGAGTWADERVAVSCTGKGEEFIRHAVAHSVAARLEHTDASLGEAAQAVIHETLAEGDGGLIAVGADGSIALEFNTPGMFRGAADANGRFDVAIWENE